MRDAEIEEEKRKIEGNGQQELRQMEWLADMEMIGETRPLQEEKALTLKSWLCMPPPPVDGEVHR